VEILARRPPDWRAWAAHWAQALAYQIPAFPYPTAVPAMRLDDDEPLEPVAAQPVSGS
jgi:hypothetical protein